MVLSYGLKAARWLYAHLPSPVKRIFIEAQNFVTGLLETGSSFITRIQTLLIRLFVAFLILAFLFNVAVVTYALFYWWYIPAVAHTAPIYFQYRMNQNPKAFIDFTDGKAVRFLSKNQPYDVSVAFHVPESKTNYELGNFMIAIDFQNFENQTVAYSSRPGILDYKSPLHQYMRTVAFAVPLLTGFSSEAQTLCVPLMENMYDGWSSPIVKASIQLSPSEFQLYSAHLHIDAHFYGLRYLMYYWFFTSAVIGISVIMFWEIVFVLAVYIWYSSEGRPDAFPGAGPMPTDYPLDSSGGGVYTSQENALPPIKQDLDDSPSPSGPPQGTMSMGYVPSSTETGSEPPTDDNDDADGRTQRLPPSGHQYPYVYEDDHDNEEIEVPSAPAEGSEAIIPAAEEPETEAAVLRQRAISTEKPVE